MGAAITIFVVLSLSVFVIRIASVALRITGLSDSEARFQSLSAFTGTGFTTSESESIVNYPVRRRIVTVLMIIGNLGLVGVLATVIVSFLQTRGDTDAVFKQLAWLLGGLSLIWFLLLSPMADRFLCRLIGRVLTSTTLLGKRHFQRLLQIGSGYSVCTHQAGLRLIDDDGRLKESEIAANGLRLLAVRSGRGEIATADALPARVFSDDVLVLFGPDAGHEALEQLASSGNPQSRSAELATPVD